VKIQETRSWPCTINMGQTGGLVDGIPSCGKKILVIKANWYLLTLNQNRTHSVTVCFNKHFRKRVLTNWSVFPIAGCNPVAINKWGGGK
jgi:hypothetical protein